MMELSRSQTKSLEFRFSKLIKYLYILIPLAIAGNFIYIIVGTKRDVLSGLIKFNILYLALAAMLASVPWLTQSIALVLWSRLFKKQLSLVQAYQTVISTELGGAIAPVIIGGGYIKLGFLLRYGFAPGEATMITLLGTIADGAFFFITLPLALIMSGGWNHPVIAIIKYNLVSHWRIAAIVLIAICIIILIARKLIWKDTEQLLPNAEYKIKKTEKGFWFKIRIFIDELYAAAKFVAISGKGIFALATAILGIGWCCRYCAISALVLGLGYHADPVLFFLLQWVVFSAATLIPSPGGIGSAELSFALVYNGLVPSGLIPILTGAWRFVTFYMIIAIDALMLTIMGFGNLRSKPGKMIAKE